MEGHARFRHVMAIERLRELAKQAHAEGHRQFCNESLYTIRADELQAKIDAEKPPAIADHSNG